MNPTYEIRRGRLLVNGEPTVSSRDILRVALRSAGMEDIEGPIPSVVAKRILRMERSRALASLAEELTRLEMAEKIREWAA